MRKEKNEKSFKKIVARDCVGNGSGQKRRVQIKR